MKCKHPKNKRNWASCRIVDDKPMAGHQMYEYCLICRQPIEEDEE